MKLTALVHRWSGLCLAGMLACAPLASAQLIQYATLPIAVPSTAYTLKVNGQPVYVEKFGEVSYARFAFMGTAHVVITASATITSASVSPLAYKIAPATSGSTLAFSLTQPRSLIIRVNALEKLLLFADGPEVSAPKPEDAGVINLATYFPADRNPASTTLVTTTLQTALDDVAALNGNTGGTLYVPDGLYMSGQLRLKSNVRLHLSSGAVIRATRSFSNANYPRQQNGDSAFIYVNNADGVRITGRGVIDGNGWNFRHNNNDGSGASEGIGVGGNCKLYRSRNSTNLSLEDVYLRDSARWTLHFLYSDHVAVRRVKIINDLRFDGGVIPFVSNTDGIDLDAVNDAVVDRCFIYTDDDALTPKVTNYLGLRKPSYQHTLINNVIWTNKCALKVGSELDHDIHDVYLANNEVVSADRFLALWGDYGETAGYTISDITAVNNRTEIIGRLDHRCFFYFQVYTYTPEQDPTPTPANIARILVNGLYATSTAPSASRLTAHDADHLVQRVTIKNMYKAGAPVASFAGLPFQFPASSAAYYRDIALVAPAGTWAETRSGVPAVTSELVPVAPEVPLVQVNASDDWGREGVDSVTFTFSRVGSLAAPLTVNYSQGGTATSGEDYAALPGSVMFPVGVQQVDVTVQPLTDLIREDAETLTLTIAADSAYAVDALGSGTATLAPAPPIFLNDATITNDGIFTATFERPAVTYGVTYEVESSTDLVAWSVAGVTLQLLATDGEVQTWRASHAFADKLFFRLKVTTP